jgi:hypothetical protein
VSLVDRDIDYGSAAVGTLVGLAGLLFLVEPVVGPLALGGLRVRPVALSTVVLALGFGLGGVVYLRRGQRLIGIAHAVGAVGWGLLALAPAFGSETALVLGLAVVVGGAVALVVQGSRNRDRG